MLLGDAVSCIKTFRHAILLMLALFIPFSADAQSALARYGVYNGFLAQQNILECENSNDVEVSLTLRLKNSAGTQLANVNFSVPALGSRHIVVSDLASIQNSYGTVILTVPSGNESWWTHLTCRTAFYRNAPPGSGKEFEFVYVLPIQSAKTGTRGGVYNSFHPSGGVAPTENWLSIINLSDSPWSAAVKVYGAQGELKKQIRISQLAKKARTDLALGHDEGQHSGVYRIVPDNLSQGYHAFLMRYGQSQIGCYDFAFPLQSVGGTCAEMSSQLSTMNNGLTDNWLEIANLSSNGKRVNILLRDRFGATLHEEQRKVGRYNQSHIYVNSILDPSHQGNVGSGSVICARTNGLIVLQSAYYGHSLGNASVEWAYATQGNLGKSIENGSQLSFPVNTYFEMANWLKLAHRGGNQVATHSLTMVNQTGTTIHSSSAVVPVGGSSDLGIHTLSGADFIGNAVIQLETDGPALSGEMLRVLPRSNGEIGTIVAIPGTVQTEIDFQEPTTGYFPSGAPWYQDISATPLDAQSAAIISWLENAGGWGSGEMRIDFSIEVLQAAAGTPFVSFTKTDDFYEPDCDYQTVPLPAGGALEGESGYQCESDGDCHLIVADRANSRLYEMWRTNLVGDTLFGGCLATWDMSRVYGPSGRGENCTSADAAGLPIAPLLFTADEVASGEINHAIRFILPNDRIQHRTYVHPGTHATGAASGPSTAPPYGVLFRLRADYPLDQLPSEGARVVARAMQRYGMFLADGGTIALTGQSDRFTTEKWEGLLNTRDLTALQVNDFEVVNGGTRFLFTGDCVREP